MESYPERRYGLALERMDEAAYEAAIAFLERNLKEEARHAPSLSLLGLALARSGKELKRAETLCREAIMLEESNAGHYLHLAEVCMARRNKEEAFEAAQKGLGMDPENKELVKLFNRIRSRKTPFFPFLDREHILNKFFGKLLVNYRI